MNKELQEKSEDLLETLQEEIIKAGGRFFKRKELKQMCVEDLLNICIPNSIDILFIHGFRKSLDAIKEDMFKPKGGLNIPEVDLPVSPFGGLEVSCKDKQPFGGT